MKKYLYFIVLLCFAISLITCKKDDMDEDDMLLQVLEILQFTESTFLDNAALVGGDARIALANTFPAVAAHETVAEAELIDSAYLLIVTKSGLRTSFQYDLLDDEGYSKYRGAGGSTGQLAGFSSGSGCSNPIGNKKVLIYAAATAEFYQPGQLEAVVTRINSGSNTYEVDVLKDAQCTPDAVKTFGNYGMVLINTHGNPDGFMTGLTLSFPEAAIPKDEEGLKAAFRQQLVWCNRISPKNLVV